MIPVVKPVVKTKPRIVCLSHDSIDMLIQLGAHHMVVGRPSGENRPEVAHAQPIGGYGRIRSDAVAALNPDLVIAYASFQMKQASVLADMGMNVLTLAHHSFEDIMKNMSLLGAMTETTSAASAIGEQFNSLVSGFEARNRQRECVRVYFEEWDAPMVAGPAWISQMIHLAGGCDVFANKSRLPAFEARRVTVEEIVGQNPDVIVASWCGKPVNRLAIRHRPGMAEVAAVKNDQIFEVDGGAFLQPGPSVISGVSILERILHPDTHTGQHE